MKKLRDDFRFRTKYDVEKALLAGPGTVEDVGERVVGIRYPRKSAGYMFFLGVLRKMMKKGHVYCQARSKKQLEFSLQPFPVRVVQAMPEEKVVVDKSAMDFDCVVHFIDFFAQRKEAVTCKSLEDSLIVNDPEYLWKGLLKDPEFRKDINKAVGHKLRWETRKAGGEQRLLVRLR
jgi:hypothetical protein